MRVTMLIPLLALWALVLVPAACPVGLVAHGCAEDQDPSCAHEEQCLTDPCNVARLPQGDPDSVLIAAAAAPAAVLPAAVAVPPTAPAVTAPATVPLLPDLPVPPAALPLLC